MASVTDGYQIMGMDSTYVTTDIRPDNPFDQPGIIWKDLDPTYGWREYVWAQNSGTVSTALGTLVMYTDLYKMTFSLTISDSVRDCLLGVACSVIPTSSYGWIQTKGYCARVLVYDGTYAKGQRIMMGTADGLGLVNGALGTAPTYALVGVALGAAVNISSNLYYVPAQLNVGGF